MLNIMSSLGRLKDRPGKEIKGFGEDVRYDILKLMKKFLIQTILLIVVISLGVYLSLSSINPHINPPAPNQSSSKTLTVNGTTLSVEISDSDAERNKGLSGRDSLPQNSGMLFVYDRVGGHTFWMKGMRFPLDFVWIRGDLVTEITENVPNPAPNAPESSLILYSPKNNVDKILELNAGTVTSLNIKVGDKLTLQ